jgi:hypothetical protein
LSGENLGLKTSKQTYEFKQEFVVDIFSFAVCDDNNALLRVIEYILKQTYCLNDFGGHLLEV